MKLSNKKVKSDTKIFYKDFDFIHLNGRKQILETLSFPYVEMDSTNEKITLKIYGSKDYFQERTLNKTSYGWYGIYEDFIKGYESKQEIHRFYLNTGMVQEISYQIDSDGEKFVNRLSFFNKNLIETFIFSRGERLYFEFNEIADYPLKKVKYKDTIKFEDHSNLMKVISTRENKKTSTILLKESKCYQLKEFSIFWWYHIGYSLEKFPC